MSLRNGFWLCVLLLACSSKNEGFLSGSEGGHRRDGGQPAMGGASILGGVSGGLSASGGQIMTAGTSALGGSQNAGGLPSMGGKPSTGGATATGGATLGAGGLTGAVGGHPGAITNLGGTSNSGGSMGGTTSTGGAIGQGGQSGTPLAFPGAQGFGRFTVGARGKDVYHVTNLNDSGPGSFRDAISQSYRTVVFDVGGVIKITSRLIFKPNLTIAGQTAPGGGITIYGDGTSFSGAHHNIIRYMRFRMGVGGESAKDTVAVAHGHDMIWDHCSISWGRDGNFDLNPSSGETITNITLQDSIVAQGLQTHSTGGLVVSAGTSIIRSLWIDNNSRNPKARGTLQFVNNIIYNWVTSGYILGDTAGRSDGAMVGCYFIPGPETKGGTLDSPTPAYNIYATGNYYDSNKNGILDGKLLGKGDFGTATWCETPSVEFPPVPALTAQEALHYVTKHAGASLWRDEVDRYVFTELASLGKSGKTINNESSLGLANMVGAVPGGTAPIDTDQDGMPDAWEEKSGLDKNNPDDRNGDRNGDGWTNLEDYINGLVPAE